MALAGPDFARRRPNLRRTVKPDKKAALMLRDQMQIVSLTARHAVDFRPLLESQLRAETAPIRFVRCMAARFTLCQRAIHGVSKMSGTNRQPTGQRGARHPASLVDSQLQHLENVMEYLARGDASSGLYPLDHEYWEKRVRALEETHELIASQRQRLTKLLGRLASEAQMAQMALKPRTAA
ncbi:hypothetical protein RI103_29545 [Paraburkholderia sp. FT54]|uniref:hypothetical protein n=1 Tax=Paraburkholderia sp. FT54 TaxID=3074437 RepID=UPI00287752ED|nr:hypothetical protein [Paraburkholderia sp. FT54]WNC92412.1 hypothetical protein RI103_29545 [Paraburkholderia sp. FT54]